VSGTDPEEGFLTFSCNGLPTGATFDDNTIAWTPTEDQVGEYTITVTAQDDHGNFGRTDFTIKVLPKPDASDPNTTENHAPNFESVDPITADVGELVSFQISASDEDGDTLTYSQYLSAGWGEFDATTRTFSGTPTSAGTYNMIFKVTDGTASDYLGVSVTVNAQTTDPEPTPPAASLDATAPETTILISGTQGDQNWYTSAVMTFSTNEDATTIYRLNNGSLTVYEGAVTLPDGDYTISYYSVDTSGNIETAKSATAKCDGSGPTLQIYKNSEELAADADICATWGESLNIAPQVADPTSGINKLEITFDDLQVTQVLASDLTLDLSGSVVTSYVTDGETIYSMNLSQSIATSSCSLNDTVTLKVTATDNAGNVSEYSADVSFKAAGGDVINYPNPVNPISENENFNFTLEQDSTVKIVVYNISGKNVWTYTGQHAAGSTTITWNCVDNFGSRLGSGLYVYRVIVNNQLYGKGKILSIAK
jgi:flagellar hook assembly protein FlgD